MEPPFSLAHELTHDVDARSPSSNLPNCPQILARDRPTSLIVLDLLEKEFCSTDLERIAPRLWWMSKQDSASISPLHRQKVKQRTIVVTEDPKLHLVWIHDRVYIKPLPLYITSFAFWKQYLGDESLGDERRENILPRQCRIRKAVLGYLRTYVYLIQHKSDFRMAQDPELCLIPAEVTWAQFYDFASDLVRIADKDVSERYRYGEIRLTRLNFYAPLLLHKSHFQRVEYQYGTYFSRFYAPILFLIGVISIILSGLQVALAADQGSLEIASYSLLIFAFWLSIAIIAFFCAVLMYLSILLFYKIVREWKFAIQDRRRLRLLEEGRAKEV